ncbi:putative bifunctional diguanylate cyclase/phosphodiesterase [Noviherbaspirillum pedocola]|uniref:Bifunctional diguanylate cyclase/phosphodiesterase n=1 Tax=Noviherbaspirillum pedocola TaxID=2801341 RepID=A0A934SV06_9BURK|nr:bifunctional diguanylate cyclase/phosphodiesterase [Noviherbaspirillum pedocola]MBK4736237.1 bifunctional diguanylate cyclase/phosphodiesterase [Noviherbaspirillum pedocola]
MVFDFRGKRRADSGANGMEPARRLSHGAIDSHGMLHRCHAQAIYKQLHTMFQECFIGRRRELSLRREAGQAQFHAEHDPLTGLLNRDAFLRRLNEALNLAQQGGERVALAVLDIDRFRTWNEALGHVAGDQLLRLTAQRMQASLPPGVLLARTGGNEFAALLDDAKTPQPMVRARALLDALRQECTIAGTLVQLSARIGLSVFPEDASDCGELLRQAMGALRDAKTAGRERLRRHAPAAATRTVASAALESSLRHAAQRGELELHYQAKVDARSHRVSGCEALLRWRHPEQGLMLPERFIPLAEETGLIVPLTRWVLHTACSQMQRWQAVGLVPGHVAVNLSAGPFIEAALLDDVREVLTETGMDPTLLELEITESMMMGCAAESRAILIGLKTLGVRIAIDDFGIGYSSLSQLKNLPVDIIKMDRSFINDVPGDRVDEAIATAIIAMGKSLRAAVVAEGVEAVEQLDFLRGLGCDQIQGYYFSKPLPAVEFEELLRSELMRGAK